MHGIHIVCFADFNDFIGQQVTFPGRGRTQAIGFVGIAHMQCVSVGIAVNGYGFYAHFAAGAHHTDGNFSAVGDQQFFNWSDHEVANLRNFFCLPAYRNGDLMLKKNRRSVCHLHSGFLSLCLIGDHHSAANRFP